MSNPTLQITLDANSTLLSRIENYLAGSGDWSQLRTVSEQHFAWNNATSASLYAFQANAALGEKERTQTALRNVVEQLHVTGDRALLTKAVRIGETHSQWLAVSKLRALRLDGEPFSQVGRLRWLQSLRRAIQVGDADGAVEILLDHDHSAAPRMARWLLGESKFGALCKLRLAEYTQEPSPRTRLRLLEALRLAVHHGQADAAVDVTCELRDEDFALVTRVAQWLKRESNWAALARLRYLQFKADCSAPNRLRLLDALRLCFQAGDSKGALGYALELADTDPSLFPRFVRWLKNHERWLSLARLRAHEWSRSPSSQPARVRYLGALRALIQLGYASESVSIAFQYRSFDDSIVARVARLLIRESHWIALAQLRKMQFFAEPDSTGARTRWLEALKLAAKSELAELAVDLAWEGGEHDAAILCRLRNWLTSSHRWVALARLAQLEVARCNPSGRDLLRWLEAVHRAQLLTPHHEATTACVRHAMSSEPFLRVLRLRAMELKCHFLISELRIAQLEGGVTSFGIVGLHLKSLRDIGDSAEAARFLDRLAQLDGLDKEASASLNRLLEREARFSALQARLERELERSPDSIPLRLELASCLAPQDPDRFRESLAMTRALLLRADSSTSAHQVEVSVIKPTDNSLCIPITAPMTLCDEPRLMPLIEHLASATHRRGQSEIWSGYSAGDIKGDSRVRSPNEIRVTRRVALFLAHLARHIRPRIVVEVGTGFGISGMYWSSALEETGAGSLITFEPNQSWQPIAASNLTCVSSRVTSVLGAFEERLADSGIALRSVDILSVDAIHTPAAVKTQIELATPYLSDSAVVLVDDIRFSPEMYGYWLELANATQIAASFEIESRVGVLIRRAAHPITKVD
jgi:predicted O-methyltransferase YrrM